MLFAEKGGRTVRRFVLLLVFLAVLLPDSSFATTVTMQGDIVVNEIMATQTSRMLRWPDAMETNPEEESEPDPRLGWTVVDYDDSEWATGPGGFGYGDSDDATDLGAQIRYITPSLYLRQSFQVTTQDAARSDYLRLSVDYDDGFIAYLNGVEIARSSTMGAPGTFYSHSDTASSHNAGTPEHWTIGTAANLLVSGTNVLSVQVHNVSLTSTDMSLIADLAFITAPATQLVRHEDDWRYYVGVEELIDAPVQAEKALPALIGWGTPWHHADYDDSGWRESQLTYSNSTEIKIQAENYMAGGEGVAFHDSTSNNVDVASGGEGQKVTSVTPGEWIKYQFNATEAGLYSLRVVTATSNACDKTMHYEIDGVDTSGYFTVMNSYGTSNWISTAVRGLPITAGQHVLTVHFDDGYQDIDYFEFRKSAELDEPSGQGLYVRKRFTASNEVAASEVALQLNLEYRGGFVAFINGVEVARRNTGAAGGFFFRDQPAYNRYATSGIETWALGAAKDLLTTQTNVLAIQIHQPFGEASDIRSMQASLSGPAALVGTSDVWRYFSADTEPSGGLADEDFGYEDWIELYNKGAAPVSLAGWSLTDQEDEPGKWVFPDGTVMEPGQYLIVFASGKNRTVGAPLHTNFNLSGAGEYLGMFNAVSQPMFEVEPGLPKQSHFYSWGIAETPETYAFLDPPTPGAANASARTLVGFVAEPQFSITPGFYSSTQNVTIACETPDALIYYTLDGKEPTMSGGSEYTGAALQINTSRALRARAFKAGYAPSPIVSGSYLIGQSAAIQSLPALAIITDPERNLYMPYGGGAISGGITNPWRATQPDDYNNCIIHGKVVERPVAVEFLYASGQPRFHTECGIRVTGSDYTRPRYNINSKFSFRLYFRQDYGYEFLEHPFLGNDLLTHFDQVNLRAGHNDISNPFIRDELARRLSLDMGMASARGAFVNLYINGVRKGYYNPTERPNEHFFQHFYGSDEEWDVIHLASLKSGTLDKWEEAKRLSRTLSMYDYQNYQALDAIFNIDTFIDYLIINVYGATWDWPHNNWGVAGEHSPEGRMQYYVWDAEGAFRSDRITRDVFSSDLLNKTTHPMGQLYTSLRNSAEFRLRFADHIQKHFYNGGALTDAHIIARHNELSSQVSAVISNFNNTIINDFVPRRRGYLIGSSGDFATAGLWPSVSPPTFLTNSGQVAAGSTLALGNPNTAGSIYYTTNGTDPRIEGSSVVRSSAKIYTGAFPIETTCRVRARVRNGSVWSAIDERSYTVLSNPDDVLITELMIDLPGDDAGQEWFELYNTTYSPVNINHWTIMDNDEDAHTISVTVEENGTDQLLVPAEGYLVLGVSRDQATNGGAPVHYAYGDDIVLGNGGDELILVQAGKVIHSVAYDDFTSVPLSIMSVIPENPDTGIALGMAADYSKASVDAWSPQASTYGNKGYRGTPGATNDGVTIGVGQDNVPPVVKEVAFIRSDKVRLLFSDLLDEASAASTLNFVLEPGSTHPVEADLVDNLFVELRFAQPLDPGVNYMLWVSGVRDVAGNTMKPVALPLQLALPTIAISELMYNPSENEEMEFVELFNTGSMPVILQGYALAGGVRFTFPLGSILGAGEYLVVAKSDPLNNFASFRAHYGLAPDVDITGPFDGSLSNSGERIALQHETSGLEVIYFAYSDGRGWPLAADGVGHSLVPQDFVLQSASDGLLDYGRNWRTSMLFDGSPGSADPAPMAGVVINELAAHTDLSDPAYPDYVSNDWVELFNPTAGQIVLNDCYLSDDFSSPTKWAIPDGTIVPAGGFVAFDEITGFHTPTTSGFGLSKAGESLMLTHLPAVGSGRVMDAVRFKGQVNGATLGRLPDGGAFWQTTEPTRGEANRTAETGIVVNEIMYHAPGDAAKLEYVELLNTTSQTIVLENEVGSWRMDGGISWRFTTGTSIDAGGYLVLVDFDPADEALSDAFKAYYGVSDVVLVGPFSGSLSNSGERVALEKPEAPDLPEDSSIWVIVDEVIYFDRTPFVREPDGQGYTLQRSIADAAGNDPAIWLAALPTPGGNASEGYALTCSARHGSVATNPTRKVFAPEETVTILVTPQRYYAFDHWSGDVPAGKEQQNPLTIQMNKSQSVEAHFVRLPAPMMWILR